VKAVKDKLEVILAYFDLVTVSAGGAPVPDYFQ
jgi:hypothetical protein